MKNNFRNCLIFKDNKLFSTNFKKHNSTLYNNYKIIIYSHTHYVSLQLAIITRETSLIHVFPITTFT